MAPQNAIGRLVGAVIMLESIAFVAIVTAAITTSFVERARRAQASPASAEELPGVEQLAAQLADIQTRLDVIQRALDLGGPAGGKSSSVT